MKKVFGAQYDCAFLYKTHHKDSGVCVSTLAKELTLMAVCYSGAKKFARGL